MRLAVLALVLSLAITRLAIAGEVRVDLSQLSELANRGDVVALMQMADAYEEEWNTGGDLSDDFRDGGPVIIDLTHDAADGGLVKWLHAPAQRVDHHL